MAAGRRFYPGRLCIWPGTQRGREGGFQLRRFPEGTRLFGSDPRASGMEGDAEAARNLGRWPIAPGSVDPRLVRSTKLVEQSARRSCVMRLHVFPPTPRATK